MKTRIKQILSVALVLSMLLPSLPVLAAGGTQVIGADGSTAIFDENQKTLTLNGYQGGALEIKGDAANITVKLVGENTITENQKSFGLINTSGGSLTITAEEEATLKVQVATDSAVHAIGIGAYQLTSTGFPGQIHNVDLTGKAKLEVEIARTDGTGDAIGVRAADFSIKDQAKLKIDVWNSSTKNESAGSGVEAVKVVIDTDNEVVISSPADAAINVGNFGTVELKKFKKLLLIAKAKEGETGLIPDWYLRQGFIREDEMGGGAYQKAFNTPKFRITGVDTGEVFLAANGTPTDCVIVKKDTSPSVASNHIITVDINSPDFKDHKKVAVTKDRLAAGEYWVAAKYEDQWLPSDPFTVAWMDALAAQVEVEGTPEYNSRLQAKVASTDSNPLPDGLKYRWYRQNKNGSNKTVIDTTTTREYQLTKEDIGKQVLVEVSHPNKSNIITSTPVEVKKAKLKVVYDTAAKTIDGEEIVITPFSITIPVHGEKYLIKDESGMFKGYNSPFKLNTRPKTRHVFYIKKQPVGEDEAAVYQVSDPVEIIIITPAAQPLTGTVILTGETKYGKTLTATVSGSNSSTLRYQWQRDDMDIAGAETDQYTLVKEDINHQISCIVSSDVESGTISARTEPIAKAEQAAPAAPELLEKTATTIKIKHTNGLEYKLNNGEWNQGADLFTGLTANTEYQIYARVKESETHQPSPASAALTVRTDQANPGNPGTNPGNPGTNPGNPSNPYEPNEPSTPSVPSTPNTPSSPSVPSTPNTPSSPSVPSTPNTPSSPSAPSKPNTSGTPNTGKKEEAKPKQTPSQNPGDENKDKAESLPFTDVAKGSWYEPAVKFVYTSELMKGTAANTFAPDQNISRGQLITVLYRLAGSPEAGKSVEFSDVKAGDYFQTAVMWAVEKGISSGYGNGSFGAADNITREQLAVLLYRLAEKTGKDVSVKADLSAYADRAEVSDYAVKALIWATEKGLINGTAKDMLSPKGNASRAQIAAILMRYREKVK